MSPCRFHAQNPLIEDSDQLTAGWSAGEYRLYYQWAEAIARDVETETIIAHAGSLAPRQEIMKRLFALTMESVKSFARASEATGEGSDAVCNEDRAKVP